MMPAPISRRVILPSGVIWPFAISFAATYHATIRSMPTFHSARQASSGHKCAKRMHFSPSAIHADAEPYRGILAFTIEMILPIIIPRRRQSGAYFAR